MRIIVLPILQTYKINFFKRWVTYLPHTNISGHSCEMDPNSKKICIWGQEALNLRKRHKNTFASLCEFMAKITHISESFHPNFLWSSIFFLMTPIHPSKMSWSWPVTVTFIRATPSCWWAIFTRYASTCCL